MKANKIYIGLIISLLSSGSYAIDGGTTVDASSYPQYVKAYASNGSCTGVLIAGKYVLTAAHCGTGSSVIVNNTSISVSKTTIHPSYDSSGNYGNDLAIWELSSQQAINSSALLSTDNFISNNLYNIYGYADTTTLKTATMGALEDDTSTTDQYILEWIDGSVGTGHAKSGDSGGPATDTGNKVVGIIHGESGECNSSGCTYTNNVTKLESNQDFLLDTIAGLGYPTAVTGDAVTIPVQNLSQQTVALTPSFTGVTVTSDTCSGATLSPLAECSITATGSGSVSLTTTDIVTVNKATTDTASSSDSSSSDSSSGGGGSFDYIFAIGLAIVGCAKKIFSKL